MINLFLVVSAIIGVILILIILFQKTEGGSLGLGTQTSLTGGMTSNKSSFTGMTKISIAPIIALTIRNKFIMCIFII